MAARFSRSAGLRAASVSAFPSQASSRIPSHRPSGFALSYGHRLHYRWEYRKFFGQSQVFRLGECTVFRIPNELGHFRLGITLKARGSSVDRNRTKRSIRESFRNLAPILGSFDYNVVVPASKKMIFPYPRKLATAILREFPRALGPHGGTQA